MEMGLHAWLLVLLFCVTFTKGKVETKANGATSNGEGEDKSQEDTDNSRETEPEQPKRKQGHAKEKGQEQTNQVDAKSKAKGQEKTKEDVVKPREKGKKQPKADVENTNKQGQKRTKETKENLKGKGQKDTTEGKTDEDVTQKENAPKKTVKDSKTKGQEDTTEGKTDEDVTQKGKKETTEDGTEADVAKKEKAPKKTVKDSKTKGKKETMEDGTEADVAKKVKKPAQEKVGDSNKPEQPPKKKVKDSETTGPKKSKETMPQAKKEGQQKTKENAADLKRKDIPNQEQIKGHVATPKEKKPKQATGDGKNLKGKGSPDEKQTKEGGATSKRKAKAQRHPCLQKLKIGPCKATIPRFWFDGRKCDVFLWGGCKPNGNNFNSKSECEEKCLGRALPLECYEPKKEGPCKAAIKRWYFNGIRCKKFNWGGCKPNGNNFETKLHCKKTCTAPKVNCLDPLKTGPCQAAIPRFRFDGRSCTKFLWGGCNPNGNNFPSKLACKLTCHGKPPPPTCVGPRKIGPCKGAIPRWWFDGHVCKKFLWGGCAPNGNNYVTKKECEKTCVAPPPNCHDPQKKGPCKGSILRYWFSGKRCKSFFWGGCYPNGNNFHSRHECEKRCLGNSNSKIKTKSAVPKQERQEDHLNEAEKLPI